MEIFYFDERNKWTIEHMTTQETLQKWTNSARRVQVICTKESVSETVSFGRQWAIPTETQKLKDTRKKIFRGDTIHENA